MDPLVLQYCIRSLEAFPVDQVFFYIPQIVQALRFDNSGFIQKFILDTAKVSQLFSHQIIWNMRANMYVEEEGPQPVAIQPDPLRPTLEKIMKLIISGLSGPDKEFFEREFKFFGEVTGISGKLKPYISKSKAEKKVLGIVLNFRKKLMKK
jgi:phosphatidylinositol 4-kinase